MLKYFLALTIGVTGSMPVSAQERPYKTPVHVQTECSGDSVGERFAYRIRENIRSSQSMRIADEYLKSIVQLQIVCIDPEPTEKGNVSRYAYALTAFNSDGYYDFMISFGVGHCGTLRVDECAENRVAGVDRGITDLKAKIGDGTFKFEDK